MKAIGYIISGILVLGGISGLKKPHEWTYPITNRSESLSGLRTMSPESTRLIAVGAILLGLIVFGATTWSILRSKSHDGAHADKT